MHRIRNALQCLVLQLFETGNTISPVLEVIDAQGTSWQLHGSPSPVRGCGSGAGEAGPRGESDPRVLEFHHVRGVKEDDISSLIGRGSSLQRLKAEVEKCDVLCANCHRKITVQERGWFKGRK